MSAAPQLAEQAELAAVREAIQKATLLLLESQHPDGYWNGSLSADTTLESDFILMQLWLYPPEKGIWNPPNREQIDAAAASIAARQNGDGGFGIYPGGPSDVSASIKAYFSLKLCGHKPQDPAMEQLCSRILELGGLQAANSWVKINLSLFGLFPREFTPSIPPEMMLPSRLIYEMSSWTRAIVVPLSIVHSSESERSAPAGFDLQELFLPDVPLGFPASEQVLSWRTFFLAVDKLLKVWEKYGSKRLRDHAKKRAEEWMVERFTQSDGLGAIFPPMMYAIMALDVLGYSDEHPLRQQAVRQFQSLYTGDDNALIQPCFSPIWDTANVLFALGEGGAAPDSALCAATDWLLSKEVRRAGDWARKRPGIEPSGWYFEFANEYYPDIDDTAIVLMALARGKATEDSTRHDAVNRAIQWLVAMQSRDGGWAAFDVDNNWQILSQVPFADHNAMLDPTCPDITGRVLEALCLWGLDQSHPAVARGVRYLEGTQEADGSWFGRWGVNYIYGTFLALRGLRQAGQSDREAHILRAGEWLRSIQNPDGGWGEDCASYACNSYVAAPSTPSQTAWAILGLLASGDTTTSSLWNGVNYLVETQLPEGGWEEQLATGTGFPRVFYLTYHLYRQYFPLLALGAFLRAQEDLDEGPVRPLRLALPLV